MPQKCRREGDGRSCMASSVPVRTLCQRSSRSARASSSWPSRSCAAFVGSVEKAREGCIGARVILSHDGLVRDTKGEAEVVDLTDTKGRHMMRLATKAGSATPSAVRRPSPPQVTPVVACHQEWSCKSSLSEAFTEARDCPSNATIKRDQQIFNEKDSVDAHVVHELGHVRALPGEDHLRGA